MITSYDAPPELVALLKRHEGLRLLPYRDTRGVLTIGYGHNLGEPIAPEVAELHLVCDIAAIAHQVAGVIGDDAWQLAPARQAALIDMGFMGPAKLARFELMIAAIRRSDWPAAEREALASQWAKDVKTERAGVIAAMLRTGHWPIDIAGQKKT
jgi:lysozyme